MLAQSWADHLGSTSVLKHSNSTYKGEPLGENVATKWSSVGADYTGEQYSKATRHQYFIYQSFSVIEVEESFNAKTHAQNFETNQYRPTGCILFHQRGEYQVIFILI